MCFMHIQHELAIAAALALPARICRNLQPVTMDDDCEHNSTSALLTAGARIAKMIRNAERAKTPVMCVIGKNEAENGAPKVPHCPFSEIRMLCRLHCGSWKS